MIRGALLLCWLASPLAAMAAHLPPDFSAQYVIEKGFMEIGRAKRSLTTGKDGSRTYVSESRTSGMIAVIVRENITETTAFSYDGDRVHPLHYVKRRDGFKNERITQDFDQKNSRVTSIVNGETNVFAIPENVLDQSIYQLNLMIDLAHKVNPLQYPIAENRKLKEYPINIIGKEAISTPFGRYDTVIIQRKDKKVSTTMWCAEKLHFLPIKILHDENGSEFVANISAVNGL